MAPLRQMEHVPFEEAVRRADLLVESSLASWMRITTCPPRGTLAGEGFDSQTQLYFSRSYAESDIDGRIHFDSDAEITPGTFLQVQITHTMDGELVGKAV